MDEMKKNAEAVNGNEEQLSLSDDRRVKTLSPGALTAKRFFRNRLAVLGLIILAAMFIFSFVGGLVSPYGQDQVFERLDRQMKEYVGVKVNTEFRYLPVCRKPPPDGQPHQNQCIRTLRRPHRSRSSGRIRPTPK